MKQVLEFDRTPMMSAKEAAAVIGYSSDYVGRLAREGKIIAQRVGRQWLVELDSLKLFSLEAEAEKRERSETIREERKHELFKTQKVSLKDVLAVEERGHWTAVFGSVAILSFLLLFGGFFYVSMEEDLSTQDFAFGVQDVAADVGMMQASLLSWLQGSWLHKFVFGDIPEEEIVSVATPVTPYKQEPVQSQSSEGVVVLNTDTEAEKLSSIRDSFSDEVSITFDGDDTGIITPIFRERENESYRFLMVPVDEKKEVISETTNWISG